MDPDLKHTDSGEGLAGMLHDAMCEKKAWGVTCIAWKNGKGSHWEFYQVKARSIHAQLEPVVGEANVRVVVRVMLEELL